MCHLAVMAEATHLAHGRRSHQQTPIVHKAQLCDLISPTLNKCLEHDPARRSLFSISVTYHSSSGWPFLTHTLLSIRGVGDEQSWRRMSRAVPGSSCLHSASSRCGAGALLRC